MHDLNVLHRAHLVGHKPQAALGIPVATRSISSHAHSSGVKRYNVWLGTLSCANMYDI